MIHFLTKTTTQYIYIYIYIVLFSPVKPELGGIPSGQKTFDSEPLNFPGIELNVTDITEQYLFILSIRSEEVLLIFLCFLILSKTHNRMKINL